MRKLKLFSMLLFLLIGIGQMWATDYEYQMVTSLNNVTAGTYVVGALRSTTATNNFYFGKASVSSGDWEVSANYVTVAASNGVRKFDATDLPTGAVEFEFTGDNTNGFTIKNGSNYLYFTASSNRKLAFASTGSTYKWAAASKNDALISGGVYLSKKSGGTGNYTISENSTQVGAIRGYANTTSYRAIYLFKKQEKSGSQEPTALAVPTGMSSGTPGMTSATLSWNPVEHADSYALTIGTGDPITTGFETVNNKITYTLNGLEASTNYTWKVKATTTHTDTYSNSADCSAQNFTTADDPTQKVLTFVLSSNNLSLPTAKGSSVAGNYTYTLDNVDYTFSATDHQGSNDGGIYFSSSYTMMYKQNALGLPAISNYKLVKVVASNSGSCSTSAVVSIASNTTGTAVAGGTGKTWSTQSSNYTYNLTGTAYNTVYYVYVSDAANAQVTQLKLTYAPKPAVESIAIKTAPKKTTYTANDNFDPSGLVITVNYEGGSSEDVTYSNTTASDFSFTPTTSTALNATNSSVTVTYGTKTANQAITVNRIATTLSWSLASYTANIGASYTFPTLTKTPNNLSGVTYSSSNTNVATINANTGAISVVGTGSTTITAAFAQTNVYAAATPATYTLTINEASSPSLEVDPNSLTFPLTAVGGSSELTFDLYGYYLTADATLVISGANANMFSVVESVDKDASDEIAETITVTYAPATASVGSHAATLTITSGVASATVTLSGTAKNRRTVTWYSSNNTELTAEELGTATTEVWDGDAVTFLPNGTDLESCDDAISFQGWTNATYAKNDDAPNPLYTALSQFPAISGDNASYYAVWAAASGDDGSVVINANVKGYPTTYGSSNAFDDLEVSGIDFKIQQLTTNSSNMQWRAAGHDNGTGTIYNDEAFPGHISSIVIVYTSSDTQKNITLKIGDSANPTSGTAITPSISNTYTYTFDCSAYNYDYFVLANGSNAGYTSSVTINYAASIKDYATTCSAPVVIADPTFDPAAGSFDDDQSVTITCSTANTTIYYTLDGSNPKTSETKQAYSSAISVTEDKTIKAVATDGEGNWSSVVTKTYTINYSSSIAAFIAKAQNTPRALKLNAAQNCIITGISEYVSSNTTKYDLYIQDTSNKGIIVYGLTALPEGAAEGKRIEGTISGTYAIVAGQHRITGADFTNATFNIADALTPAAITAVNETAYNANPMMLVKLSGVYYNTGSYYFTSQAEGHGTSNYVYDKFKKFDGKTMPANTVACNITGVIVPYVSGNTTTYELFPYSLTTATPAVLPTISPVGSEDSEQAHEVTYLSTVSVSLVDNEDIYVSINDAEATKLTEAVSIQIENDTKIAVTAKRDFYADNAVTYYYKPSSYPKQIEKVSAHGTMLVKVGDNEVSTALPTSIVNVTVSNVESHFTLTGITVKDADNGDVDVSKSENVYSFTMPNKNVTITANYSEDTHYTITYSKGDATDGSAPAGALAWQYAGEDVELLANAYTWDDDHKFTGWKVTYNETEIDKAVGQTFQMPAANVTITAQWAAKQYCALTLRVNGQDQTQFNVERQEPYDLTSHNPSKDGYTFYGWAALDADVSEDVAVAPTILANHIFTPAANEASKKLYAVFKHAESEDTKDVLTAEDLAAEGTGYIDFSGVSKTSDAVYAGSSALDGGENIQLRSKNSNSGIVSTTSGGIIKSVKITVAKGSNTVDVYGSHSAYEDATSLFGNSKGTNIGSTSATGTIIPTAQQVFEYVGIRSNDGAIYLSSVEITWTNSTYTYTTIPATLYDVTYILGDGEWSGDGCPDTQVKDGMGYSICAEDPVRDGYKFVEWQIGGVAKSGEITISGNTEIVAVWTPKAKSALTYAPGVGSGEQQTTNNVEEGTVITLPSIGTGEGQINFSKTGYKFVGWNDGTDTYASGASFTMPAQDVTLTAQWEEGVEFSWVVATWASDNKIKVNTDFKETYETFDADANISMTWNKNTGSSYPAYNYNNDDARLYQYNSLTFTAADGFLLKRITLNFNGDSYHGSDMAANCGEYDDGVWTGFAKSVTITNTGTENVQARITSIDFEYITGTVTTLSIDDIALKMGTPKNLAINTNVDPSLIEYNVTDESVATVANGVATPVATGSTSVTATIAKGTNHTAAQTTFTITVSTKETPTMSFPQAEYNAYLGVDFAEPVLTTVPAALAVTYSSSVPGVATVSNEEGHKGEISLLGEGQTVITATFAGNDDYATNSANYTLNVIDPTKDVLTAALIGKTSYEAWSDKTFGSGVKYAGYNTTGGGDKAGSIQMNANPGGIVTTSAIGYLKSLSATAHTGNTKALEIYAKGTAYESSADLYSSDASVKGTKIGTIAAAGDAMVFEEGKAYGDNYKYIGIKSVGGAVYYDEITITWTPAVFEHFDVTYKAGEAEGLDVVESIEEGSLISLKAANTFTAPEGKMFAGWLLEGEENAREAGSKYAVTAAATFTAQWVQVYTITYKAGEGTGDDVVVENVPVGNYELAANTFTAPESKEFAGWKLNNEGETLAAGANYNVTGNASFTAQWSIIKQPAGLAYTTTSYMITRGRSFEAPELTNPHSLVVTYSGNNDEVATVDAATGAITLKGGIGTVTVTATSAETDYYYAGEASYTLKVKDANLSGGWERLTSASTLVNGMKVIIAEYVASGNDINAMGEQKANNRGQVAGALEEGKLVADEGTAIFTLVKVGENTFAFKAADKKYLYAASSSQNYLKSQAKIDGNATWKIDLSEGGKATITAQGNYTHNVMRYNKNSSLFSCYTGNQQDIALYSKTIAVSEGEMNASTLEDYADVVVAEGATLVIDNAAANKPLGNITGNVEVNAPLQAEGVHLGVNNTMEVNSTVNVPSFSISVQLGSTGQATNVNVDVDHGASIAAPEGYVDMELADGANPDHWHSFTVPFEVDALNGIYDAETGAPLQNEVNYAIMDYHGEIRANGDYGWKKYRSTLKPGVFYLITVDGESKVLRFMKKTGSSYVAGNSMEMKYNSGSGASTDFGWCGVGNQNMFNGYVPQAYTAQVLNATGDGYEPISADQALSACIPFFIQVNVTVNLVMNTSAPSSAPLRMPAKGIEKVQVTFGNEAYTDKLYISASEEATNEYEIGKDLLKMTMTNTPSVPQIFGNAYGNKLCVVNAPMSNDQAVYDLTLYAPQAGEYTISAPAMENAELYLTYEGNIIWNLSMSAYPMELKKGNTEGYGLLLNAKAPMSPTGIENIDALNGANVQKVILDEKVFILRGGKMYDVTGKAVK